jgi:hypothetical protein
MNKPLPVNPPELRSTFVAASSMPWQRTDFDGIEMKILYKDDEGRSTIQRSDVHLRIQPPEPLFRWYEVFHFHRRTEVALARVS